MESHIRIASMHLAMMRLAKPKYLKAIDYTIGLLRRLDKAGILPSEINLRESIRRLADLRQAVQDGFDLSTLARNRALMTGRGSQILKKVEAMEFGVVPDEKDIAAFMRDFPTRKDRALERQARMLEKIISDELGVHPSEVRDRVLSDQNFMSKAFAACTPVLSKAYSDVVSRVGKLSPGKFEHRMKNPKSAWKKQTRATPPTPFYELSDLIGVRSVVPTLRDVAQTATLVQSKFEVLRKRNNFLEGKRYNAINYLAELNGVVFEYQVKTHMGAWEATLSHDLIYESEKAVINLDKSEKELVGTVIDVSTQLSMREWQELLGGIQMRMARSRQR